VIEKEASRRTNHIRDQRIEDFISLKGPEVLLDTLPLHEAQAEVVVRGREEVKAILDHADDRLLAIVGPCSVHDVDAAHEYAERLAAKSKELEGDLRVAMRVYFEKPRTTTGWKGLINDPGLDDSGDVNRGFRLARGLLLEVLELGIPVGCEWLDPITPAYISDLVAWGAIGARTTESQIHRQLASGLSMPIGFKNRTDGNVDVAVDAVRAAAASHVFTGVDPEGNPAILHTSGNEDCHVILRGGRGAPNYAPESIWSTLEKLDAEGLPRRVIVDASHDNSGKDHERQPLVVDDIASQVAGGSTSIVGVMVESFLVAGNQPLEDAASLVYGQSITDKCMDWDTTVDVLDNLAAAVRARRGR